MAEKLVILDYLNNVYETDVELENIDFVEVEVLTGDEVIKAHMKDGSIEDFDAGIIAGCGRMIDYHDDYYVINAEQLGSWNKRNSTYDHFYTEVL